MPGCIFGLSFIGSAKFAMSFKGDVIDWLRKDSTTKLQVPPTHLDCGPLTRTRAHP